MLYIIVFLSLCGSLLCHDAEVEFVNKRPKIHEHKLTMRELSSVKSEDNSNRFEIDKIDDYFNVFRSDLDALNQKKLHKQLSNLVNDVEHHLRKSGFINNANVNEFINTGLKNIHKKFNFNRHIEEFLLSQKNNEVNYFLHSNSLGDELMKAKDWNSKKNGPKRFKVEEKRHERILVNNQPPKVQEQVQDPLVDRKQSSYSKKDYFQNNVKYMKHRYHDVHPKFTDQDPMKNDLFDEDDSF